MTEFEQLAPITQRTDSWIKDNLLENLADKTDYVFTNFRIGVVVRKDGSGSPSNNESVGTDNILLY